MCVENEKVGTGLPYSPIVDFSDITSCRNIFCTQCLSQDLDFFSKKGVIEIFRELFAKESSYPSTAKIWRMYIKCTYYMPEHVAII